MRKNKWANYLAVAAPLAALGFWHSVQRAAVDVGASTWTVPALWFLLVFFLLSFAIFLCRDFMLAEIAAAAVCFGALLFSPSKEVALAAFLATALIAAGARRIRTDLDLNIRINLAKSLRTGKALVVLALALMVAVQYYALISTSSGEKAMPRIQVGSRGAHYLGKALAFVSPQFASLARKDATVDEFILSSQQENLPTEMDLQTEQLIEENLPTELTPEQRQVAKRETREKTQEFSQRIMAQQQALLLAEGRRQLGILAGRELQGSESVSQIFTLIINKRIAEYLAPDAMPDQKVNAFPLLLATLLLLTILPLGSFLSGIVVWVADPVFKVLARFGLVGTERITVERERIIQG